MSAVLRGPLDVPVKQIIDSRTFLTDLNIRDLRAILPQTDEPEDVTSLRKVLNNQLKLFEKLQKLALASEDIGENAKAMQSTKQLLDVMLKFEEKIDGQSRQIHIENAVVEAFNELNDDALKAKFMQLLQKNLSKKRAK